MSSFLLFVFGGQKDVAQMPFSLRCVHCMVTSVLRDQQYMFGVKSLLMVTKVLLMRKDLVAWSPCCFDDQCNDRSSRFSHVVRPACDRINIELNFDDTLKMKR